MQIKLKPLPKILLVNIWASGTIGRYSPIDMKRLQNQNQIKIDLKTNFTVKDISKLSKIFK